MNPDWPGMTDEELFTKCEDAAFIETLSSAERLKAQLEWAKRNNASFEPEPVVPP